MTVGAGNAIADYILNARPKADSPYVFLRLRRPYERLNSRTPAANIMKLYQSDGFYHQAGDGKGFHSFRRTTFLRSWDTQIWIPPKGIFSCMMKNFLPAVWI